MGTKAGVPDLLLLARADEYGLDNRLSDVDLDDLAYRAQERLQANHPQLRVDLHLQPVRIVGDPDQLDRAIVNLCDNAGRHARSSVTLSVWADAQAAHLSVVDDGPGIAPENRERVFDRFVRLDDSRARSAGGAGLGLAITRKLLEMMSGRIWVESEMGQGSTFTFVLPVAQTTNVQSN